METVRVSIGSIGELELIKYELNKANIGYGLQVEERPFCKPAVTFIVKDGKTAEIKVIIGQAWARAEEDTMWDDEQNYEITPTIGYFVDLAARRLRNYEQSKGGEAYYFQIQDAALALAEAIKLMPEADDGH